MEKPMQDESSSGSGSRLSQARILGHHDPNISIFETGSERNSNRTGEHFSQDSEKHANDSDSASTESHFTETTCIPKRSLGAFDVTSLIINQMVGTGIFTTPGLVLAMTGSKPLSLVLWAVGGVYTFLSITIYLEFGTALPFTGGGLIYLDEMFPKPELLATILFSVFFVLVSTTAPNCLIFARYILLLANSETPSSEVDDRLVILVAILTQTLICFLLYFSRRFTLLVNKAFALYKITLMLAITVAGFRAWNHPNSGTHDFGTTHPVHTGSDGLGGLIFVFVSYQGWENANYVAGEIMLPKRNLKIGAFSGIAIVTAFYMLTSTAYYVALQYDAITDPQHQFGVAVEFASVVFGHTYGIQLAVALSALGNVVAMTYSISKVRRAIALQGVIPFYQFFGKIDPQFGTPGGALILHWFFTVLQIACPPLTSPASSFVYGLFDFGNLIIMCFVGLGLFRLRKRMATRRRSWKPSYLKNQYTERIFGVLFVALSLMFVVEVARTKAKGQVPGFWWPIVTGCILVLATIYWAFFRILPLRRQGRRSLGETIGIEVVIYKEGDVDVPEPMIHPLLQAKEDGTRRRLDYTISGPAKKCANTFRAIVEFFSRYV